MRDGALAVLGSIAMGLLVFGGIEGIIVLVEMALGRAPRRGR